MDETKATFEQWLKDMDQLIRGKVGLGVEDMVALDFRAPYGDGLTPADTFDYLVRPELEDLGFQLEIADLFDDAQYLRAGARTEHIAAEAGLDYVTDGPFDSDVDEIDHLVDEAF